MCACRHTDVRACRHSCMWRTTIDFCSQAYDHHLLKYVNKAITRSLNAVFCWVCLFVWSCAWLFCKNVLFDGAKAQCLSGLKIMQLWSKRRWRRNKYTQRKERNIQIDRDVVMEGENSSIQRSDSDLNQRSCFICTAPGFFPVWTPGELVCVCVCVRAVLTGCNGSSLCSC